MSESSQYRNIIVLLCVQLMPGIALGAIRHRLYADVLAVRRHTINSQKKNKKQKTNSDTLISKKLITIKANSIYGVSNFQVFSKNCIILECN